MPPAPERAFASDNAAGAHPAVLEAARRGQRRPRPGLRRRPLDRARPRRASATCSARRHGAPGVERHRRQRDGAGLAARARRGGRLHRVGAHQRRRDRRARAGPGAKLIAVAVRPTASCDPEQHRGARPPARRHAPRPAAASCRSPRRPSWARVYTADEIGRARATPPIGIGMRVHMDGARIANATAALGGTSPRCARSPSTPAST